MKDLFFNYPVLILIIPTIITSMAFCIEKRYMEKKTHWLIKTIMTVAFFLKPVEFAFFNTDVETFDFIWRTSFLQFWFLCVSFYIQRNAWIDQNKKI